jgi:thioesterase domain-containing protein/acyl carrier protein
VAFGPRWKNVARMRLAGTSGIAELDLPRRFAGELDEFAAHPAIVDVAATFGLHLVGEAQRQKNLFVPLSIERIRLVAPVPRRLISRVQLQGPLKDRFASFDVSLHAPDGSPVATFEGFSMQGIDPQVVWSHSSAHAQREPTMAEAMLSCGIKGEDSPALFQRILSDGHRDLVVSSIDPGVLKRVLDAARPRPVARAAADSAQAGGAGALNPVERVLADAWRELLGVEQVAGSDDFFALGGHSLAAVRLFARIRKQFAVDLPLASLFQAPTLAALAALVAQAGGLDQSPGVVTAAALPVSLAVQPAWSPLVTICKGNADRQPLFMVHGAGGNVLNFKIISDRLGPEQPFYGLQAQGVDGRMPPLDSIHAMAAQYIEAIRSVQPVGPYRLGGYSAGGLIAFEMAQQLKQTGTQVTLLAMIDTLCPTAKGRKVSLLRKLWLMRHWSLKFALEWPVRRRQGKIAVANYANALGMLSRGESLPPELLDFHLYRNFIAAQGRYRPEPYDGSMVLMKAAQADTEYLQAGRSLGWNEHIRVIRVIEIAGSHLSMMAEPGVSQLVEAFANELSALDESAEDSRLGWRGMVLTLGGAKTAG